MNNKAEPKLMDTGTFFVETKRCTNCHQKIVKLEPDFPGQVTGWVHRHNSSMYCHAIGQPYRTRAEVAAHRAAKKADTEEFSE